MLAATVFSAIVLATGVTSLPRELQFAASDVNRSPFDQYQYLVLVLQDSTPELTRLFDDQATSNVPSTQPYRMSPKTRMPATNWHSYVFGPHSLNHGGNSAAHSTEDILGGNGLDTNFAGHQASPSSEVHPPQPTFPAHLRAIQSRHPQGNEYWEGLQGDQAECPMIYACPARYGCYVMQKVGTRCPYCKCASRTPNKINE